MSHNAQAITRRASRAFPIAVVMLSAAALTAAPACGGFLVTETNTLDALVAGDDLSVAGLDFSDWRVNNMIGSGGAVGPEMEDITVEAGIEDGGRAGLRFLLGAAVGPGQLIDYDFNYTVSSAEPVEQVSALLDGAAANGTGLVSIAETLFSTFPGSPVSTLSVSTLSVSDLVGQAEMVPALEGMVVRKNVILSGGLTGTASLGSFFQLYQTVPEPSAMGLWLMGVVVAGCLRRRGTNK